MDDRLARIDARLRELDDAFACLLARVAALEQPASLSERAAAPLTEVPAVALPSAGSALPIERRPAVLPLVGRTFVVLGGAFLLRALTESGQLPLEAGVGLGLAYAILWFGAADWAGARRPLSGAFHGLAGAVIGLPLLWEASTRFHLLVGTTSAAALGAIAALALAVAWHRRLPVLAALMGLGPAAAAAVLAVATGQFVPYALLLVAIALSAWWIGRSRGWHWLGWPVALAADAVVVGLAARALADPPVESPGLVVAVQLLLAVAFVAAFSIRMRRPGAGELRLGAFEIAQTSLVLAIGLGGSVLVAGRIGPDLAPRIGLGALAAGGLAYGLALAGPDRRVAAAVVAFDSTLGLMLLLIGASVVWSGATLGLTFAALSAAAVLTAVRWREPIAAAHGAAFLVAAAAATGLLAFMRAAWFADAPAAETLAAPAWVPIAVGAIAAWLIPSAEGSRRAVATAARVVFGLVAVFAVDSVIVMAVARGSAGSSSPGLVASLATAVLAATAVGLALAVRSPRHVNLRWIPYAVLAAGAAKLLVRDLRVSRPATLFAALAIYGVALILVSRWRE